MTILTESLLGNNITNGHNQLRIGVASDLFDGLYLKTAMIDKKDSSTIDTLPRASFINVDISKAHVFKVDKENITFEPASASNIKTYDVYGKDADIVISVMRYNQNTDMLIFSE